MSLWFFSYGSSSAPEQFTAEVGPAAVVRPGRIKDYELTFVNYRESFGGGTSAIVPAAGEQVIGTAYFIEDAQRDALAAADREYGLVPVTALIDGTNVAAEVLLPHVVGDFAMPADSYVGLIRTGLSAFYTIAEIDPYLRRALRRDRVFADMVAQWVASANPKREYNSLFRRLLPWHGVVRTPWGGAMATISPGDATDLFPHDEEEIAFVVSGSGELRVDDNIRAVTKGDVFYFQPDCEHVVKNTHQTEMLEVLFLWWGGQDGVLWAGRKI